MTTASATKSRILPIIAQRKLPITDDEAVQFGAGNEPIGSWLDAVVQPTVAPVGDDLTDDRFNAAVAKALKKYEPMLRRLAE